MGLDTKYRPHNFEDVLGQESTIKVIKRFVCVFNWLLNFNDHKSERKSQFSQ